MQKSCVILLPFSEIFKSIPHIFATCSPLRVLNAECWAAWITGDGAHLHAEYILIDQPRGPNCFKWDRILLPESTECKRDQVCFRAEAHGFEIKVVVIRSLSMYRFTFIKRDLVSNISIKFQTYTAGDDYIYGIDDLTEQDWWCSTLTIITPRNNHVFYMGTSTKNIHMVIDGRSYDDWRIYNHNILDIIAFMKTSRLDVGNYMPRYMSGPKY